MQRNHKTKYLKKKDIEQNGVNSAALKWLPCHINHRDHLFIPTQKNFLIRGFVRITLEMAEKIFYKSSSGRI